MSGMKAELARVLQQAGDALRAGASARQFAALLYAPDLVVVGEGWPRAIRGVEAFLPDLTTLLDGWGPNADLTFTIVDPVLAGGDVATTLVDVYVAPKQAGASAEHYRVVYGWRHAAPDWRVATEMYTVGTF